MGVLFSLGLWWRRACHFVISPDGGLTPVARGACGGDRHTLYMLHSRKVFSLATPLAAAVLGNLTAAMYYHLVVRARCAWSIDARTVSAGDAFRDT